MWKPWRVSLLSAAIAGGASLLLARGEDTTFRLALAGILALQLFLLTLTGLWLSRRPVLPTVAAMVLVILIACIGFLESLPIKTHAVLMDMPSTASRLELTAWANWLGISLLILPAVVAFAAGLAVGAPPEKSMERNRER
jgi:hypothetical protein